MKYSIGFIFLLGFSVVSAQEQILTVEECLKIALEKNIQLKQAQNNLIVAKANRFQAIMNYLPSLNAGGGYHVRNGNYFDNTVDRFITETTRSFNVGASASVVLFNGLNNKHTLQSATHAYHALEADVEGQEIQVKSDVLQAYLNVLIDKENLRMSGDRLELLLAQLDRAEKRESVGVGNLEDVYNLQSQVANEQLNQVTLHNKLQSDMLTLIQVLRLNPENVYDVESFDDQGELELSDVASYDQVLNEALSFAPSLQSARSQFLSSRYSYMASYSNYLPMVSAYYSYGTGYSSNGAINPESGQPEENAKFFTQLDYNVQPSVGIEFTIPIFTRYRNITASQTAKVNMRNAELDIELAKITITNTVQSVYQDLIAAQSSYEAARENLRALEQSFNYSRKRYETGNTDFYTYLESLNNKNRAEIELVNAKYGIIFRKKVLELYRGL